LGLSGASAGKKSVMLRGVGGLKGNVELGFGWNEARRRAELRTSVLSQGDVPLWEGSWAEVMRREWPRYVAKTWRFQVNVCDDH